MQPNDLLLHALEATAESEKIDFKKFIDVSSKGDWCEIIKDLVAMANSGGGVLLIGLNDEGNPSGQDVTKFLEYDPADITNKLFAFTGKHFSNFTIVSAQRNDQIIAALVIGRTSIPLVFVKSGDYSDHNGRQKQAFGSGMLYFRHGAKSEPCTSDDLQQFLSREIEILRESWFNNIRKVVEAPDDAQIVVLHSDQKIISTGDIQAIRLVDDPNAPVHQMLDPNRTHPHRAKEILNLVNSRLINRTSINSYDILAIRRIHNIDNMRRFYYRPLHGTALYSDAFVNWLVEQYEENQDFFNHTKAQFHEITLQHNAARKTQKSITRK